MTSPIFRRVFSHWLGTSLLWIGILIGIPLSFLDSALFAPQLVVVMSCVAAFLFAYQFLDIERRGASLDFLLLLPRPLPVILLEIAAGATLVAACGALPPLLVSMAKDVTLVTPTILQASMLVPFWAAMGTVLSLRVEGAARSFGWFLTRGVVLGVAARLAGEVTAWPLPASLAALGALLVAGPACGYALALAFRAGPLSRGAEITSERAAGGTSGGPRRLTRGIARWMLGPLPGVGRIHPELGLVMRGADLVLWGALGACFGLGDETALAGASLGWLLLLVLIRQVRLEFRSRESGLEEELTLAALSPSGRSAARLASTMLLALWTHCTCQLLVAGIPEIIPFILSAARLFTIVAPLAGLAQLLGKRMSGIALPVILSGVLGWIGLVLWGLVHRMDPSLWFVDGRIAITLFLIAVILIPASPPRRSTT